MQPAQLRSRFHAELVDQPPPGRGVAVEGLGGPALAAAAPPSTSPASGSTSGCSPSISRSGPIVSSVRPSRSWIRAHNNVASSRCWWSTSRVRAAHSPGRSARAGPRHSRRASSSMAARCSSSWQPSRASSTRAAEPVQVDVVSGDSPAGTRPARTPAAAAAHRRRPRRAARPAQAGDVAVQRAAHGRGRVVAPDPVDQRLGRHGLVASTSRAASTVRCLAGPRSTVRPRPAAEPGRAAAGPPRVHSRAPPAPPSTRTTAPAPGNRVLSQRRTRCWVKATLRKISEGCRRTPSAG